MIRFIYSLLSKYYWNRAQWLRKQVRICECHSAYWSFRARGFSIMKEVKLTGDVYGEDGSFCRICGPTNCTCKEKKNDGLY